MDITNKTAKPLSLPLPGGKKLFLGPGKTGQVSPKALKHPPLVKLIESGDVATADATKQKQGGGGKNPRLFKRRSKIDRCHAPVWRSMNLRHILRARKFRSKSNPAEIDWIMANIQPGANVFDVGCHKGDWTYWLHKAVGKTGHIYSFEPQPTLNAYLTKLFTPSAWENVTLENIALTNGDSVAKIFVPGELGSTSSGASLIETTLDNKSEVHATEVPTTTLDNYVAKHSISPVGFIKVSVKGSEINVLEGAENLRKNHDLSWIIESETRQIGEAGVEELFAIMETDGYQGFFFPGGKKTPLSEFSFAKNQRRDFPRFWEHPQYCNSFLFDRKG